MTKGYRLTDEAEPSDADLAEIMHEVAVEAKEKSDAAEKRLREEIALLIKAL